MLVLSRQISESLLIGDDIRITILKCHHSGSVSIGIEAPREIEVIREELLAGNQLHDFQVPSRQTANGRKRSLLTRFKRKIFAPS